MELATVSLNENDLGVEIHDIGIAPKFKSVPRRGCSNGEIFEKSEMENSIFSPNNAAGNRGQGKMAKNIQTKLDETLVLTIPNKSEVSQKNSNSKIGKSSAPNIAMSKFSKVLNSNPVGNLQSPIPQSANNLCRDEDKIC